MQNVLWTIVELLANLIEAFLCTHFIINSLNGNYKILNSKTTHIIGTVGFAAVVTILNNAMIYEGALGIFYTLFFFVFSHIFMRGHVLKKVFISILLNICLAGTAAVSGNILSSVFSSDPTVIYTEHSFERLVYMIVGIAFFAYVSALLSRFTDGRKESLNVKEWVLILSVLGISFLIFSVLHLMILYGMPEKIYLYLLMSSEIGIIFINILCLYITANLNETHKREEQLLINKRRSEYSQQYAQTIKEQYEQTRRLRHDMKQYASAMHALIKDEKLDAAKALAEEQTENLSNIETFINVENDFLNSILNSKLSLAKSKGIDVFCSIENDLSGIEDIDLCNLMGNLLDNAITAAEKCDPESRLTEVEISSVVSRLVITVKNSIKDSVLGENPKLKSTKQHGDEHGFGIKTIKYIAEKYNGKVDYYEDDLMFISRIELRKAEKNK